MSTSFSSVAARRRTACSISVSRCSNLSSGTGSGAAASSIPGGTCRSKDLIACTLHSSDASQRLDLYLGRNLAVRKNHHVRKRCLKQLFDEIPGAWGGDHHRRRIRPFQPPGELRNDVARGLRRQAKHAVVLAVLHG